MNGKRPVIQSASSGPERWVFLILVLFAGVLALPVAADIIEIPTVDDGEVVRIVVTDAPGGLAIDPAGNVYYSSQGGGFGNDGTVVMLRPPAYTPITIVRELNNPGDIEVSPDGRALLIAYDNGRIERHPFGLTVQLKTTNGLLITDATVYATTAEGTSEGEKADPQGYYTLPGLLTDQQESRQIQLTIERPERTAVVLPVELGAAGQETPIGQTFKLIYLAD